MANFKRSRINFWQAKGASAVAAALMAFAPGAPAQAQEEVLYLQKNTDARTLDPQKLYGRTVVEIVALTLDTLVTIEDDLATIRDGLASEWSMSADGLTYKFTLKDGLKFCDGKALTAKEVESSFRRWLSPATKSANAVLLGPVSEIAATSERVVEFKLKEPYAEFLSAIASPYAGVIDAAEADRLGDQFGVTGMNGSGPYCWDRWKPREEISLKRNPLYKAGSAVYKTKGPVRADRVVFQIMPEENARVAALLTGQSHASYYLPWSAFADIRKRPDFEVSQPRNYGFIAFVGIKAHRPLMELPVRKAMNYAIDRAAIVEQLYAGEADPAPFIAASTFAGFNKAIESKLPRYDVKLANKILEDAGWKLGSDGIRQRNGTRLAPVLVGYNTWRERLEAVQGMMREVGIDLVLQLTDTPIAISRMNTKDDFDMFGYFASYNSIGELLQRYFISNQTLSPYNFDRQQGKELSDLVVSGRRELDADKRTALYGKAQEMIADNFYWLPLTHERMLVVHNKKKISGVLPHGIGGSGLYKGIDLAPVKQ